MAHPTSSTLPLLPALDALGRRLTDSLAQAVALALLESSAATAAKQASDSKASAPASDATVAAALESWTAEWVSARRASVVTEFEALPPETQADWAERLRVHLQKRGAHPSIRKRLTTHGWKHPLVTGELIRFFKGIDWDKPTSQELLGIAAQRAAG